MTQAEKLEALVRGAVGNGYANDYRWRVFNGRLINEDDDYAHSAPLIFDHDFARALFGEGEPRKYNGFNLETGKMLTEEEKARYLPKQQPLWQSHLQQAVISEDPIDYMYKAVFGEEV
jgi:hypothetical protein